MHGNWLVVLLAFANIPILILLVWIMFDEVREGHGQLLWGIAKALGCVFSFGLLKRFLLDDADNSFVNSLVVLGAYTFLIVGEYWAIAKWFPSIISEPFTLL